MFKGLVIRRLHDEDDISLHNVGNNPEMRCHIKHRKPQQSNVPSPGNISAFTEAEISPSKNSATGSGVLTFTPLHPTLLTVTLIIYFSLHIVRFVSPVTKCSIMSHLPYTCYMCRPSHISQFKHHNGIGWTMKIMKISST
jgi:hypothetical protein